jgi:putative isomerase
MMSEHLYNPEEFWGEWMMPSIARNDPAYKDQVYWRGRIWAPMNFLVYLAMKSHGLKAPCMALAEKSKELILKEWIPLGHIHENYNADTGEGCDSARSDKFYHWGALLSLIALMDAGHF